VAETVVKGPLLLVGEDLVGLAEFLELALGLGVVRVQVGVILAGQPAVGPFDGLLVGVAGDAKHLVGPIIADRGPGHNGPACARRREAGPPHGRP